MRREKCRDSSTASPKALTLAVGLPKAGYRSIRTVPSATVEGCSHQNGISAGSYQPLAVLRIPHSAPRYDFHIRPAPAHGPYQSTNSLDPAFRSHPRNIDDDQSLITDSADLVHQCEDRLWTGNIPPLIPLRQSPLPQIEGEQRPPRLPSPEPQRVFLCGPAIPGSTVGRGPEGFHTPAARGAIASRLHWELRPRGHPDQPRRAGLNPLFEADSQRFALEFDRSTETAEDDRFASHRPVHGPPRRGEYPGPGSASPARSYPPPCLPLVMPVVARLVLPRKPQVGEPQRV